MMSGTGVPRVIVALQGRPLPPSPHAPMGTITAGYSMQIVTADLLGPLPESENGNSYVLVVADYFTRMDVFALPN